LADVTRIFGSVAAMYDDVRPGYPRAIADAIVAFHGRVPATIVEVGAGTGKGTEILVRIGAAVTCVEPDERMAAVLRANFPGVRVVTAMFEQWDAPPGGVDVIACALAWHWLDPATRSARARAALAPGGTLAVFGHTYGYADPAVSAAIDGVLQAVDPTVRERDAHWIRDDVAESGEFTQVEERIWHTYPELTRDHYLRLVQTFSSFRRHSAEDQRAALSGLTAVLGDTVTLDLTTTLVLARAVDPSPEP
jgi:SAM-dependent methyltransferase